MIIRDLFERLRPKVISAIDYTGRLMCHPHCICCDYAFDIDDDRILCSECYEQVLARVLDTTASISNRYVDKFYYCFKYGTWYSNKLIAHAKYVSSRSFVSFISGLCAKSLHKHNLVKIVDYITYAPRRPSQVRYYGFDQSKEIAVATAKRIGIPCKDLLKRVGISKAQKELKHSDRRKNIIGKFRCDEDLSGKTILLIDDVLTTGSTTGECAKMLKNHGAKRVFVWAIAK